MKSLFLKAGKRALSFLLLLTLIAQSMIGVPTEVRASSSDIDIQGYQINTSFGGFRTVYTIDSSANVSEKGLIYGLQGKASEADMVIGSTNSSVHSYAATSSGCYATKDGKDIYVMTMKFGQTVSFYTTNLMIKPYVKLSDGTYSYGTTETVSVFAVADELYKNSYMNTEEQHNYLYDNILVKSEPSYERVDYIPYVVETTEETTTTQAPTTTQEPTTTENVTTTVEESTIDPSIEPKEVFGQTIVSIQDNKVTFNWGADDFIYQYGQLFNVYIDDVLTIKEVPASEQSYTFSSEGVHTIRITGVLNGKETAGQTLTVTIGDVTTESQVPSGFVTGTVNEWETIGSYGVYYGNWAGEASVAHSTSIPLKVYFEKTNAAQWLVQFRYDAAVTAGHKYRVTAYVNSDQAGRLGMKEDLSNNAEEPVYFDIVANAETALVGEYTVSQDTIRVMFEAGSGMNAGTTLTINSISIEDITGGESQTTTQQPETTTQQETTTYQETTTQPETTTHRYVEPGVQSEAADSDVASDIRLTNYFDSIDTVLSSTLGNTSGGEGIERLFDNNTSTKFFTGDAPSITIAWKMKRAVVLKSYTFVLAGDAATYSHRDPHCWSVYGSIDGENWITLSNVTDGGGITHVNYGEYTFSCTTQTPCQYFMLIIKDSGTDGKLYYGSQMSEIFLNGDVCKISEEIGNDITGEVKEIRTGDTTISGYNSNEGVDNLFDSNNSTKLYTTTSAPCSVAWTMNQDTTLYSYTLTTANDNEKYKDRTIKSWQLYGSTDGSSWTLIDTVNDCGMMDKNYADYTYMVDKVGTYKHYKLTVTERYGTSFQLSGITLRGSTVIDSEYKALFVGDWDAVTASGYQQALHDAFYEVYPRQYTRWGIGTEPKKIFVTADKGYDGVAYTAGSSIVISVEWMNNNPTGIGYFTHELTHAAQQYGNITSSGPAWWVENMANYGGFRYFHWASPETAQVYYASDTSLQDWGYEAYGNNKWFFAYMDSRYPTTKDANGNVTYGLIDALNHLLKDNKGTTYDDNPYDTTTPWNQTVKRITGYDCIESLRLHYVDELNNGTWNFTGFKDYADNWITEDIPGVPNIDYPEYKGKIHGNTTHSKLSSAITSGTNLMSGASVISTSGQTKASEAASMFIDGDLSTKWCATSGSVDNAEYSLEGAQHFIKIDLGSTKTFNTYTLYNTTSKEGYGNTTEWEILISNDGENWTSLDYQSGKNDSISSYDVGSQSARYIVFKVFNADNGGVGTVRLYELQLYNR